jgi:hypothetical protein
MTEHTTKDWSDDVKNKYAVIGMGGKYIKDKAFMQKQEKMLKRDGYIIKIKILTDTSKIKMFFLKDNEDKGEHIKVLKRMGNIISEETL